ncbi:MAG: hypothetical protein KAT77_03285 [Nanoarchaeota archaeon]|nr:hypothetical protein [Nanoarchaeota archaeon]
MKEDKITWEDLERRNVRNLLDVLDLFDICRSDLSALAHGDVTEKNEIAERHVLEIDDVDYRKTVEELSLQYLKDFILNGGNLNPKIIKEVVNCEPAIFSKLREDKTGMTLFDRGELYETMLVYPSGFGIKLFRNKFNNPKTKTRAERAQKFYFNLANYAKEKVSSERDLLDIMERFKPVEPLHSNGNSIDNIFINSRDLYASLKNASVDERANYLEEVNNIDLIMGFFSDNFKRTKPGEELYRDSGFWNRIRGKKLFNLKNYKKELFEDILIPVDRELEKVLGEEKVINSQGEIIDAGLLEIFCQNSKEGKVWEMLGLGDSYKTGLTTLDPNLRNIMMRENGKRSYAYVDFERYDEDSITAFLPKRLSLAGLYDHNGDSLVLESGESAEENLLKFAYRTLERLGEIKEEQVMSWEDFKNEFSAQKRKYLLRTARRFKLQEGKDKDPEKMRDLSRFFYTLFDKEVEGHSGYLDGLFGKPLGEEEMKVIYERHDNPSYGLARHMNPKNLEEKLIVVQDKLADHRKRKKRKMVYKIAGGIMIPLAVAGGIASIVSLKNSADTLAEKVEETERERKIAERFTIISKYLDDPADTFGRNTGELVAYDRLLACLDYVRFDQKTGFALFLDSEATLRATHIVGSWEYKDLEPYLKKNYPAIYWAMYEIDSNHTESWAVKGRDGNIRYQRGKLAELETKIRQEYKSKMKAK